MSDYVSTSEAEMNGDFKTSIIPEGQLDNSHKQNLFKFLKEGYGDRWISDSNFWDVMIRNCTQVLEISSSNQLAAVALMDYHRISDIAVNPNFRGQGLGVKLFQEAAKTDPDVWISIEIDASEMLATITDQRLNFLPIGNKDKIENLFRETNRARDNYQVEITEIEQPLVSKRLANKGTSQNRLAAFNRVNATHGASYLQILFQNQG